MEQLEAARAAGEAQEQGEPPVNIPGVGDWPRFQQAEEQFLVLPQGCAAVRDAVVQRLREDLLATDDSGQYIGLHVLQWNPRQYDINGFVAAALAQGGVAYVQQGINWYFEAEHWPRG